MGIPKEIAELIEKYLTGTATDEERTKVNQWYHRRMPPGVVLYSSESEEEIGERIKTRLTRTLMASRPVRLFRWQEMAKIAAVFLVICLSAWLYRFRVDRGDIRQKGGSPGTIVGDIHPGGNRATLTLADGSKVDLDSTTGEFSRVQGNTRIVKTGKAVLQCQVTQPSATPRDTLYNEVTTPNGGQYAVKLADGTDVWLNSASSIRFPAEFGNKTREVEITGEVYFEVAPANFSNGGRKPFIVHVNKHFPEEAMDVEVMGTHFNINAYRDEAKSSTTLLEGKVRIRQHGDSVVIKPGEQASVNHGPIDKINVTQGVDLDKVMAWRQGRFEFDDTELPVIMRQIGRWYNLKIEFEKPPDNERFGGSISRSAPISAVLKLLESDRIRFSLEGNRLIVKP